MSPTYSPVTPVLRTHNHRGGILLNAVRHPQSALQSPLSPSYTTPSSPSSSDSSDDSANRKSSPTRRITFAPLPQPRAYDYEVPSIVLDPTSGQLEYENPEASYSFSGDDRAPSPSIPDSPMMNAKKSSSWSHSTKKLLRPFYKPLKATLDVDSGGALGLFRSSSRDSCASSVAIPTDPGAPLARRMSTGSSPFDPGHSIPDRSSLALTPVVSENGGVAAGTRMLNGRVYGGNRIRAQQPQKIVEPEFVEWGSSGMGSNRGASASTTYTGIQSSHKNAAAAEEDDDGSGMGWVRRRRQAREREKREREAQEAEQREQAKTDPTDAVHTEPSPAPEEPTPIGSDMAAEHITRAVNIPARPQTHHHLRPSNSRLSSDTRHSNASSGRSTPMISKPSNDSSHTVASVAAPPVTPVDSALRSRVKEDDSESLSESDGEDGSTEDGTEVSPEDDDDESEQDENERATSRCAGVEKISRHKE